jgi:hypothetical protein
VPFVNIGELRHSINLHWRPTSRSAAAPNIDIAASGFIPAAMLDGGAADLWLGRGDREGPDCFLHLSARSPPHILGTHVLLFLSFGVFCNNVHLHFLDISISFQALEAPLVKKKESKQKRQRLATRDLKPEARERRGAGAAPPAPSSMRAAASSRIPATLHAPPPSAAATPNSAVLRHLCATPLKSAVCLPPPARRRSSLAV